MHEQFCIVSERPIVLTVDLESRPHNDTGPFCLWRDGTALYAGAGRRKFYTMLPLSAEGRTAWLKASYSGQEAFRLFTYAMGIVPEVAPRGFSE